MAQHSQVVSKLEQKIKDVESQKSEIAAQIQGLERDIVQKEDKIVAL